MKPHATASATTGAASTSAGAASTSAGAARALAPTGRLRVGLYPGSPTSIVGDPASPAAKGVGFELGRDLARRAGVAFEPVVLPRNADVLAALKEARVDVVFTNATPARAADMDFSQVYLRIEQGWIVRAGAPIAGAVEVDRAGVRVGVAEGSTSATVMPRLLGSAEVVRATSVGVAVEMLREGRLDAFASNKAILFEMADVLPGSRVLDASWGAENYAAGIPKGRDAALPLLRACVDAMIAEGVVTRAIANAGVRAAAAGTGLREAVADGG